MPHRAPARPDSAVRRGSTALLFLAALAASPALAAWQPDGVPLSPMPTFPESYSLRGLLPDGANGAYALWQFRWPLPDFSGDQFRVDVQRVDVLGNRPAPWPAAGANILSYYNNGLSSIDGVIPVAFVPDGSGGAIQAQMSHTPLVEPRWMFQLHHVAANGVAAGFPNFSGSVNGPAVLSAAADGDGAGGVVMAASTKLFVPPPDAPPPGPIVADRIDANGTPLWAPVILAPGANAGVAVAALSDGAGGGFFAWVDLRESGDPDLYVQHVDAAGVIPQDWPSDGVLVCGVAGEPSEPHLVPDGQGGVIVVWRDERTGVSRLYAHRVLDVGVASPAVPADGRQVATGTTGDAFVNVASDGQGGCFVVSAGLDLALTAISRLHRLDDALLPRPGWPAGGIGLNTLSPGHGAVGLVDDGAGGAYVSYRNGFGSAPPQGLYAQHFAADGSLAPGWTVAGYRLSGHGQDSRVVRSGAGAIVAWSDSRPGWHGVYAQRVVTDGPVSTQLALVAATAVRGRVSLHWYAADAAGLAVTLERRGAASDWASLGGAIADGTGHLRYEDTSVEPGTRLAYRAAWFDEGARRVTDEVWVDVPAGHRLALAAPRPNPSTGSVSLVVTLAADAPAVLDLIDLAGRRVASRDLGALGAGSHAVQLEEASGLAPGVYVLRLTQNGETRTTRLLRTP